jgi:hypothetical protein
LLDGRFIQRSEQDQSKDLDQLLAEAAKPAGSSVASGSRLEVSIPDGAEFLAAAKAARTPSGAGNGGDGGRTPGQGDAQSADPSASTSDSGSRCESGTLCISTDGTTSVAFECGPFEIQLSNAGKIKAEFTAGQAGASIQLP